MCKVNNIDINICCIHKSANIRKHCRYQSQTFVSGAFCWEVKFRMQITTNIDAKYERLIIARWPAALRWYQKYPPKKERKKRNGAVSSCDSLDLKSSNCAQLRDCKVYIHTCKHTYMRMRVHTARCIVKKSRQKWRWLHCGYFCLVDFQADAIELDGSTCAYVCIYL